MVIFEQINKSNDTGHFILQLLILTPHEKNDKFVNNSIKLKYWHFPKVLWWSNLQTGGQLYNHLKKITRFWV